MSMEQWVSPDGRHLYRGIPSVAKRTALVAMGARQVDAPAVPGPVEVWRWDGAQWIDDPTQDEQDRGKADQRRQRIRDEIGDRSELIDLAMASALGALFRGEPFSSLPQRYRRVLQRLEAVAKDPDLMPGDEA